MNRTAFLGAGLTAVIAVASFTSAEAATYSISNEVYGYNQEDWVSPYSPLSASTELTNEAGDTLLGLSDGVRYITPPPANSSGVFRSPWENSQFESTGVFTSIDGGKDGWFQAGTTSSTFNIAWGSPDDYNEISFYNDDGLITFDDGKSVFTGDDLTPPDEGTAYGMNFVTFSLVDVVFNKVKLSTSQFAFEFAAAGVNPLQVAPVPLPAGILLLISGLFGLGFLGRFKTKPA